MRRGRLFQPSNLEECESIGQELTVLDLPRTTRTGITRGNSEKTLNPRPLCFAARREADIGFANTQIVQGFGGV
jgi:hypothetical protein